MDEKLPSSLRALRIKFPSLDSMRSSLCAVGDTQVEKHQHDVVEDEVFLAVIWCSALIHPLKLFVAVGSMHLGRLQAHLLRCLNQQCRG